MKQHSGQYRIDVGPMDITRRENERNVAIPCPFSGPHVPLWKINDAFYEISMLPADFFPNWHGLLIPIVTRQLNGTTFQCFAPTDSPYQLLSSSEGKLLVAADS